MQCLIPALTFFFIESGYVYASGKSMLMRLIIPILFIAHKKNVIAFFIPPAIAFFVSFFNNSIPASFFGLYHRGGGIIQLFTLSMLACLFVGVKIKPMIVYVVLAHAALCIWQRFLPDPILWHQFEKSIGFCGNSNMAATLLVMGLSIALQEKKYLPCAAYIVAMLCTDSKAAYAVTFVLCTYHFMGIRYCAVLLLIAAISGLILVGKDSRYWELFNIASSSRYLLAKDTIGFINWKIFLLGNGLETFNILSTPMPSFPVEVYDSSHNNYLDKIIHGGILYLASYFWLIVSAAKKDGGSRYFYAAYLLMCLSIFDSPPTDIILWAMIGASWQK